MCSSAFSAVRVLSGSIATMCAPCLRALRMNFHRWWPLVSVFVPHSRISFECSNVSGSIPAAVPVTYVAPTRPATLHAVMSCQDAPSTFHSRCPARPSRPWM